MNNQGIERRRHRVYVTRNTEYHLRDGVCVGVRDRHTESFRHAHIALRLKLEGRILLGPGGPSLSDTDPEVGDALLFLLPTPEGRPKQITTSRVERIGRPAKQDLQRYV